MIRCINSTKLADNTARHKFWLNIHRIEDTIRYNRMRWLGNIQRMDEDLWSRKNIDLKRLWKLPTVPSKEKMVK